MFAFFYGVTVVLRLGNWHSNDGCRFREVSQARGSARTVRARDRFVVSDCGTGQRCTKVHLCAVHCDKLWRMCSRHGGHMMRATTAHQKNCVFARIGPLDQCVLNDKSRRKRLRRVRVRSWACSTPLRSSLRAAFTASPQRLRLFPPHPALSAGPGLTKCERKRRLSLDHVACRGQLEAATAGRLQPFSVMFHRPRNVCTCWSSHCHMDDLWEDVCHVQNFFGCLLLRWWVFLQSRGLRHGYGPFGRRLCVPWRGEERLQFR